ncbi:MAG: RNA polymerase sigma factor [Planctomycetota bacterium]
MVPLSDQTLDERAFAAFLERADARLRAFARRLVAHHADADDLVQDALQRAWRSRSQWDPTQNGEGWLLRTAFHAFLDLRDRQRRQPPPSSIAAPEVAAACDVELREEIEHALAALRPIEREVLLGFHREGHSVDELAAQHGVPVNTVKSHLHRARQRLRRGERR